MDYWTYGDYEGVEFHVVASCTINGQSGPYADHYYWYGLTHCFEVSSWHEVVVALGKPGYLEIEVRGDNELDIGLINHWGWEVWSVGDPPEPYEIVLCEPDHSHYTGGQGSATFSIQIRSNWGESEHLSVGFELRSNLGEVFSLAGPGFSLGIGDEFVTEMTWEVPVASELVCYGATVNLRDDGADAQ